MADLLETYGALALIGSGIVLLTVTGVWAIARKLARRPIRPQILNIAIGSCSSGAALVICGFMIFQVFDDARGINRLVGNVLTLAAAVLCLGIGLRAYNTSRRTMLNVSN